MRIKIIGSIIEKSKPHKTNYRHETYSALINKMSPELAEQIHSKQKFFRLLTFSNVYIKDKQAHFYIVGEDTLVQDIINHLIFDNWIRIDDMVLEVYIEPLLQLQPKQIYKFKSDLIVNISQNNKCVLCQDMDYIEKRLKEITLNKAKQLNIIKNNINIKILDSKKKFSRYKNHHIESWQCVLQVKGDYELVNMLYSTTGIGENTASGHGLMWEVN